MTRATAFICVIFLAAHSLRADQKLTLQTQLALERQGFSPGLIDGKPGQKTAVALGEFQRAHHLSPTGVLDPASLALLELPEPVTAYSVTEQDLAFVTGAVPRSWLAKSKLEYLGYASLAEELAEKGHTSRDVLVQLNPGKNLAHLAAGDEIKVPNIQRPLLPRIGRLEVDLGRKMIRGFDGRGEVVALFHCSIAAHAEKRPSGAARVVSISNTPTYTFNPRMWPEVKDVKEVLTIPPGPRNPVGLCWIGLSLPGYGMHGTPNPELIGKTGSHGCFRLTNWDAVRLGKMVRAGVEVRFE
jgi:lipoprotein-anchoring transpeptidase ErfK/SrfK